MLLRNVNVLTAPNQDYLKGDELSRVEIIQGVDITIEGPNIKSISKTRDQSLSKRWVMPAFSDPHTHAVFCGKRENEIDRRKEVGYEGMLREGGGIHKTVRDTSNCSEGDLYEESYQRIIAMMKNGTGVFEIKTGYGNDFKIDHRMIRVMDRLKSNLNIVIKKTLLAHIISKGYTEENYVAEFVSFMEEVKDKIDYVDVFIDQGAFSVASGEKIFKHALKLGIDSRVHLNEVANLGGLEKLSKLGIKSYDHMVETHENEIDLINSVVTFLPFTSLILRKNTAIFEKFLESGKILALGSDISPNSYVVSMPFVISLARQLSPFSLQQLLNMVTINSSYSLGLSDKTGTVHTGKKANLIVLKNKYDDIGYIFGDDPIEEVILNGKPVRNKDFEFTANS